MSIMMVTHDIGVAAQVADQIAIMYGGIILECGATRQVLETPANPYTKALIAALPKSGNRGAAGCHRGTAAHHCPYAAWMPLFQPLRLRNRGVPAERSRAQAHR